MGLPTRLRSSDALAKTDVDLLTSTAPGINETQNVTITGSAAGDKLVLTYSGELDARVGLRFDLSSDSDGLGRFGKHRDRKRLGR